MAQELRNHSVQQGAEHRVQSRPHNTRRPERPQEIERRVVVPLIDEIASGRVVYHESIARSGLAGALLGALTLGFVAWLVASGLWSLRDIGQFAASGPAVATFTGAGLGAALGGLAGALFAVYRLPAHHAP